MPSPLETVVDETSGSVSITRERKPFPLPPVGMHKAVCIKAELRDSTYPDAQPGDKNLNLTWELDATYENEDDPQAAPRKHRVFTSFGLAFSPKAKLHKAIVQLTGEPPRFKEVAEIRGGKKYIRQDFIFKQFENMVCSVVIEHTAKKERTYANVATFIATDAEKAENCKLLPPSAAEEAEVAAPRTAKKVAEDPQTVLAGLQPVEKPAKAKKEPETVPEPVGPGTAVDALVRNIEAAVTRTELDQLKSLMIDGVTYEPVETERIATAYRKRWDELA